jgi:lactoylglutathione lyase
MIPIRHLFETHLTVRDLPRSVAFYRDVLGLELAGENPARDVAFFWLGGRGRSMLGLWGAGSGPLTMKLHLAFAVEIADLLAAPAYLEAAGVVTRAFGGAPSDEPSVLAWMPAASIYFTDPDGHSLEFLSMLPGSPRPDLGVVPWSRWLEENPRDGYAGTGSAA